MGQSPPFSVGRADLWPQSQGGRIPPLSLEGGLAMECGGAGAGGGTPGGDPTVTGATKGQLGSGPVEPGHGWPSGEGVAVEVGVVSGTYHSVWAEGRGHAPDQ